MLSALQGLQMAQRKLDRDAERIAAPADAEAEAGTQEDSLDPGTFVDATILQPALYRANAQVLRTGNEALGSLLDVLA